MSYTKTTWTNSSGQPISAANLNHIETGIADAHSGIRRFTALFYGAKNDGSSFDNIPKINDAITAAYNAGGGEVFLPAGTYEIWPDNAGNAIVLKDNVALCGEGYGTRLKVRNANGNYTQIIGGVADFVAVKNARVRDLRIDQNAANVTNTDIQVGGNGQYAIRMSVPQNFRVHDCYFDTCSGVNTVIVPSHGGYDVEVSRCYFNFKQGTSTGNMEAWGFAAGVYDNSTVYIDCPNHRVVNNTFVTQSFGATLGAIETHHSFSVIDNNNVDGFNTGVNLVGPQLGDPGDTVYPNSQQVSNNTFKRVTSGVKMWPDTGVTLRNVSITGNLIHVAQIDHPHPAFGGITVAAPGDIDGILISDNTIFFQEEPAGGRTTAGGIAYSGYAYANGGIPLAFGGNVTNLDISDNVIFYSPLKGIHVSSTSSKLIRNCRIRGNFISDSGHNDAISTAHRYALYGDAVFEDLVMEDNHIVSTQSSMRGYGWCYLVPLTASLRVVLRNNRVTARSGSYASTLDNALVFQDLAAASQTIATSGTISVGTGSDGLFIVTASSAVTSVIMAAGVVDKQRVTLLNRSTTNAITFNATPATSRVAEGTSSIPANRAIEMVWDSAFGGAGVGRWVRVSA